LNPARLPIPPQPPVFYLLYKRFGKARDIAFRFFAVNHFGHILYNKFVA